jgi:virulence-associated protein VagC
MHIAKVFRVGRSQAIRVPKEFRVETDEVYVKRRLSGSWSSCVIHVSSSSKACASSSWLAGVGSRRRSGA